MRCCLIQGLVAASLALIPVHAKAEETTATYIGRNAYRLGDGSVVVTRDCKVTGTEDVEIAERRDRLVFLNDEEDECPVVSWRRR